MKQLLVNSMLCFSCDRPVTVHCPILVMEKMKTMTNITRGFKLYPPDFKRDANDFKLFFLKNNKHQQNEAFGLSEHPLCANRVFAACINHAFFLKFKIHLSI